MTPARLLQELQERMAAVKDTLHPIDYRRWCKEVVADIGDSASRRLVAVLAAHPSTLDLAADIDQELPSTPPAKSLYPS